MLLSLQSMRNPVNLSYTVHKFCNIQHIMFLSQFDMLFTLKMLCVHEVCWTKSNLWGLVREKCFVFCFCSVLSHEELSSDHMSHEKLCHWNTCHMKRYVTVIPVTWKDMSLEHLSHEKMSLEHLSHEQLCHWNTCHMKRCHWNTCHMKCYVTGTLVTWKVMSLEHLSHAKLSLGHMSHEKLSLKHLSHEKLCHWNTCHMKSYVTGTLVTWKIISLEHLSHEKLRHWNTCHMNNFVTGTSATWKVTSLEHLSYEKLCHWNMCHMKSYVIGTPVTRRVMLLEHLSHEELCHWNTCHMNSCHWNICHIYTFSKGNKWFKKFCAISNTHEFSSVPHDPTTACKKAYDCCCQKVILTGFQPSIKKKKKPGNRCISNMQYNHIPTFKHV